MLIHIIIWVSLLIAVITFVSAYNIRALRQAKNVVSQIAGGDFSVRIDKYPKDEIGEICNGVNDMANRLEAYFEEKLAKGDTEHNVFRFEKNNDCIG